MQLTFYSTLAKLLSELHILIVYDPRLITLSGNKEKRKPSRHDWGLLGLFGYACLSVGSSPNGAISNERSDSDNDFRIDVDIISRALQYVQDPSILISIPYPRLYLGDIE